MELKVYKIIKNHKSLFVLGISSIFFFFVNILLKENLNPTEYGLYSILITYFSLLTSFGLLGLDQTIIRTSYLQSNDIIIDSRLTYSIIYVIFFLSLLSTFVVAKHYNFMISYSKFFIFSVSIILIKLLYQISRLLSKFTLSQLILNFWKCFFSLVVFIILFLGIDINLSFVLELAQIGAS